MQYVWAPAGMGKGFAPPGNVVKSFLCCKCCLNSLTCCQLLGHVPVRPHTSTGALLPMLRWGTSVLHTPSLPTPGKKSCGRPWQYGTCSTENKTRINRRQTPPGGGWCHWLSQKHYTMHSTQYTANTM